MLFIFITLSLFYWQSLQFDHIYYPKKCTELNFLPMPNKLTCNLTPSKIYQINNPCKIKYSIKIESSNNKKYNHIIELISDQQQKTFKCSTSYIEIFDQKQSCRMNKDILYQVNITLHDSTLKSTFTKNQQTYQLQIKQNYTELRTKNYVGLVRGLETFLQSITCDKKSNNCYMQALPISISDTPSYQYRGILIDTSRHYLPIKILKQTVDAMMYNKMNIFHWHIVDEDSFPLQLQGHPQLAQFGAFSSYETYSIIAIKDFIRYAMVRGVRIIPEIDTPGHTRSWAKAPKNSKIACSPHPHPQNSQANIYKGTLDITLHQTYKLVQQVFKQIFEIFPDPIVHLGGDQVRINCLNNLTEFLHLENITRQQLQTHYRRKQRKILKKLNKTKQFIYWINNDKIIQIQQDDIVHWWGSSSLVPNIKDRKIIISKIMKQFYIDMGAGMPNGGQYYKYGSWYDMYLVKFHQEVQKSTNKENVIGIVVALWAQLNNIYTHHTKIWIRTSSMAQKAWTVSNMSSKTQFLRRITAHERIMNRRGIPTSPATNQQCQFNPQYCQK